MKVLQLVSLLFLPSLLNAHDNHPMGKMAVEITRAVHSGHSIDVDADLYLNGGQAMQLDGISVAGGEVVNLPFPLLIDGDGARNGHLKVSFTITFFETAPHVFSAMFDFGPKGTGPVLIIPEQMMKGIH